MLILCCGGLDGITCYHFQMCAEMYFLDDEGELNQTIGKTAHNSGQ